MSLAFFATVLIGWAAWRVFGGYPPTQPGVALSRRELAALAALADAAFPADGAIGRSGCEAGVPRYVDGLVALSQPRQRVLMRLLFFLVEHGTLFFPASAGLGSLRRFSALPPEARVAWLESWRTSSLFVRRLAFTSLRAVLTLGYFADAAVQQRLDLEPFEITSPVCAADLLYPRIGAPRESVELGSADVTPPSDGTPLLEGRA
jgi:hypothetical protein